MDNNIINYAFKDEMYIVPIFDVHYGSPNFNEKAWKRTKAFILSNPNIYCVFGGDIIENQTKNTHAPFEQTCSPSAQRKWYKKQLVDLKDHILCGTVGNHTMRKDNAADDSTIDQDCFEYADLDMVFRPEFCALKVNIGTRNEHNRQSYMFIITHGSGGGTTFGTQANKGVKNMNIYEGVDCMITGHTHKPMNFPAERLVLDSKNNKITSKTVQLVVAPAYLKYGGYAASAQLQPAPYQDMVLKLTKRAEKKLVLINDYNTVSNSIK